MPITAALLPDAQRKRKNSSSNIDIDNNVIEYEILPRLPAKSVCRFKSVSKNWNSFLSTRIFGKMHHDFHHMNKSYKLLLLDKPPVQLCSKPLNHGSVTVGFNRIKQPDPRFDSLVASLDGLVCVASTKMINSLALWNPFTGAYYKLPSNPNFTRPFNADEEFTHMGEDVVGLYSDDFYNDRCYKVFYLVHGDGVYIYSQKLNSWRKIEFLFTNGNYDPYPFLHRYRWSRATFCDHSLYFSVKTDLFDQCIVCFDVNTEEFRIIQFPPLPSGARCQFHVKLVVIDGCIHLCAVYEVLCYSPVGYIDQGSVWKLNGDGATWVQVAFFPGVVRDMMYLPDVKAICTTRNARDTWLAISDGGFDNSLDPFQVMNLEEFTLTAHLHPLHTYHRIIYDETLVSPYPP